MYNKLFNPYILPVSGNRRANLPTASLMYIIDTNNIYADSIKSPE